MPRKPRWRDDLIRNDPYTDEFFFVVRDYTCDQLTEYLDSNPEAELDRVYYGMNSLAIACKIGDIDKVKLLHKRGAAIFLHRSSATARAVTYGHLDILKYLLDKVKKEYSEEDFLSVLGTSLYYAVQENDFTIIEYLLENGADPNYQREPRDLRPIDWARSPWKNLDAFLYMLPLTTPRYRKTAMKNMEFLGFEQAFKRAKSEEEVLELRAMKARYDEVVAPYKKSKRKKKRD